MVVREINSTADLTPYGLLGYAKGLVAVIAAILVAVTPFLPDSWQRWAQIAIAIAGAIGVIAVPNRVQTVTVNDVT